MEQRFFQDYFKDNHCFGCGIQNHEGLRIKSRWESEDAVCFWEPQPMHCGPKDILNGGIIAAILDCHSLATATMSAYRAEGRQLGTDPDIICVTGSLSVNYLKPTPLAPIVLRACVREREGRRTVVEASLFSDADVECVRSTVVAVRLADRPRLRDVE